MNRAHSENADEVWIAKYRAALKDTPVQQSRFMRVHAVLNNARNIVSSHIGGILHRWTQTQKPVPSSASGLKTVDYPSSKPTLISKPQTSTRKINRAESSGKQPSKKATATTGRLRPPRSTNEYRA
jgi:hypothetical protein